LRNDRFLFLVRCFKNSDIHIAIFRDKLSDEPIPLDAEET
jgi:hypothetical protein